jgi:hypothetical protein
MNTNTVVAGGSRLEKTLYAPADATNMSAELTVTKFRFPAIANGVRGWSCPALKVYGHGSFRSLERACERIVVQPKHTLWRKGIFLPQK